MLLIAEHEVPKVQKEVRNAIGDFGLLNLIGESDITLNERAIKQTMNWNKNEQLKTMLKFMIKKKGNLLQYMEEEDDEEDEEESDDDIEEEENIKIDETKQSENIELIELSFTLLNETTEQLKESQQQQTE
ncbi:MAG: hypothetical protein EZS28_045008, partial [Streblomastix strix]